MCTTSSTDESTTSTASTASRAYERMDVRKYGVLEGVGRQGGKKKKRKC